MQHISIEPSEIASNVSRPPSYSDRTIFWGCSLSAATIGAFSLEPFIGRQIGALVGFLGGVIIASCTIFLRHRSSRSMAVVAFFLSVLLLTAILRDFVNRGGDWRVHAMKERERRVAAKQIKKLEDFLTKRGIRSAQVTLRQSKGSHLEVHEVPSNMDFEKVAMEARSLQLSFSIEWIRDDEMMPSAITPYLGSE